MGQALRTLGGSPRDLDRAGVLGDRRAVQQLSHAVRDPVRDPGRRDRRPRRAVHAPVRPSNLYSLIGIILLIGLVTKNGILLVRLRPTSFANATTSHARTEWREAAQTRFRPIIMTTVAMVAGMLPLALGLEPGGAATRLARDRP